MNQQETILQTVTNVLGERKVDPITSRRIINIIENDAKFKSLECQPTETKTAVKSDNGSLMLVEQLTADHIPAQVALSIVEQVADDKTSVYMSSSFFNGLHGELEHDKKLIQFLGVSLRTVLPYAEQEAMSLHEAAHRDNDEILRHEITAAHRAVTRAQSALNYISRSKYNISNLTDDAFDDDFQVVFDDEEEGN